MSRGKTNKALGEKAMIKIATDREPMSVRHVEC